METGSPQAPFTLDIEINFSHNGWLQGAFKRSRLSVIEVLVDVAG